MSAAFLDSFEKLQKALGDSGVAAAIDPSDARLLIEQATSAALRRRLQRAHGALSSFRAPASAPKPVAEWVWAQAQQAYADLTATQDLPELLESTRPDTVSGTALLQRLRELADEVTRLRGLVARNDPGSAE